MLYLPSRIKYLIEFFEQVIKLLILLSYNSELPNFSMRPMFSYQSNIVILIIEHGQRPSDLFKHENLFDQIFGDP